jgi:hypothetical protein
LLLSVARLEITNPLHFSTRFGGKEEKDSRRQMAQALLHCRHTRIIGSMAVTIELTEDQVRALSQPHPHPPQVLNPRTNEAFVLLRVDQYKRLTEELYDDSPWTREEIESVARQTANRTGWEVEDDDAAETR